MKDFLPEIEVDRADWLDFILRSPFGFLGFIVVGVLVAGVILLVGRLILAVLFLL